jgi:hypothetical protein
MTGPALNNNSFNRNGNNLRPFKPFGLNVKVPERTLKQIGETIKENAGAGVGSVLGYLAKNENVFNGKVASETDKLFVQGFNTSKILENAEIEPKHKFEMHM